MLICMFRFSFICSHLYAWCYTHILTLRPGVSKQNITIEPQDKELVIHGETSSREGFEAATNRVKERHVGTFWCHEYYELLCNSIVLISKESLKRSSCSPKESKLRKRMQSTRMGCWSWGYAYMIEIWLIHRFQKPASLRVNEFRLSSQGWGSKILLAR